MPKHGDCKFFIPETTNAAASEGLCDVRRDEEDLPMFVNMYDDIEGCELYEAAERIRTNASEFTWDKNIRVARGFEEK